MSTLRQIWNDISAVIINKMKIHIIEHHFEDIMSFFSQKLRMVVGRYCNSLPRHIIDSENEDLAAVSQLELIETIKNWDPLSNEEIWPFAQTRIMGAMRDHIRFMTKSNPSTVYQWVVDQAQSYISMHAEKEDPVKKQLQEDLGIAMKTLTEREAYIVKAHTKADLTFKSIGEKIQLSESQVSRVYKKAIEKLREEIKKL